MLLTMRSCVVYGHQAKARIHLKVQATLRVLSMLRSCHNHTPVPGGRTAQGVQHTLRRI